MPYNAIIIGFPRSGTSLTATIFANKGFYVTEDEASELRPGDDLNPFGYWEAHGLIEMNVDVLRRSGFKHHNTWLFEPISPESIARIKTIPPQPAHRAFVDAYQRHQPWVWKDPRLCLKIPLWWQLVDRSRTRVLLVKRDPEAIYRSFLRAAGWRRVERKDTLDRIARHYEAAESAIGEFKIPHIILEFEEYLNNPELVAAKIGAFFDIPLVAADLNVHRELDHSRFRGRLMYAMKNCLGLLPEPSLKRLRRLVPERLVKLLFPEKRYVAVEGNSVSTSKTQ